MFYLYFLKSTKSDFTYIGSTNDLKRRLKEHNSKTQLATKSYAPFKLIYYEAYASKSDAIIREKKLKQFGATIGHLKKRIRNSLGC